MTKRTRKITRKSRADYGMEALLTDHQVTEGYANDNKPKPILPKNERQDAYLKALKSCNQVIALGPAGTGKSFLPATYAADQLRAKKIKKIILTRPNVPGGRSLGAFPGTLEEKFAPWAAQIIEDMKSRLGASAFEYAVKKGQIEMVPFEVMRGRSWDNAFIFCDEAQNATIQELKMFLTRQGEGSTVIMNGDISQSDLRQDSGLSTVIHLIKKEFLDIPIIEFELDDIVRSGACADWVRVFHRNKI